VKLLVASENMHRYFIQAPGPGDAAVGVLNMYPLVKFKQCVAISRDTLPSGVRPSSVITWSRHDKTNP
jgi:hypothetical protein